MDDSQSIALAACRRLLRPVIRLLLRHGVMHRDLSEICKELYVDIASSDYGLQGRPTNVSRTALLTGLDRKEVKRLRNQLGGQPSETPHRRSQDRLSRVLSGWHQDPDFTDEGRPRELRIEASPSEPTFTALVRRYGGDVPPSALLKELKRVGAVDESHERLRALKRYYMPAATDAEALRRAGSVLEELGDTLVHNLFPTRRTKPRFERRATNIRMPVGAVAQFREFLEARGQSFLEEVDAWLSAHEAPPDHSAPVVRLGAGLYWIEDTRKEGALRWVPRKQKKDGP